MGMEVTDVFGCSDYADLDSASELTDTETEVEEYACTPRAFERTVPRSLKRTYGVLVADGEVVAERRERSRVDEQLALLRAAVPNLCTSDEASILAGASEYLEKLLREVQELHDELDTQYSAPCIDDGDDGGDVSSCEDNTNLGRRGEKRDVHSNAALEVSCGCSHPMVEVVRSGDGVLKIHIQCEKRPRVLAGIMEMLESTGMSVKQVSIAYHGDSQFVFDCVGSEVDGDDAVDCKYVETRLKSLIARHRAICGVVAFAIRDGFFSTMNRRFIIK